VGNPVADAGGDGNRVMLKHGYEADCVTGFRE
jgi:hypothetical protein